MTIGQHFNRAGKSAGRGPETGVPFDRTGIMSTILAKLCATFPADLCTLLELKPGASHFSAVTGFDDVSPAALPASLLDQMLPEGPLVCLNPRLYAILLQAPMVDHPARALAIRLPEGGLPGHDAQPALAEATALLKMLLWHDTMTPADNASAPSQVVHADAHGALSRLTEAQALVVDLINEMLRARFDKIDATFEKALAKLGEFCGSDRTYLFVETGPDAISNTHEWCAEDIAPMKEELQDVPRGVADIWWTYFEMHGHVYIEDVADLDPHSELRVILEMQGIISLLAVPLYIDGRAVGFMGYDSVRARRSFLPGEIYLLKSIANVIATLLSRRADEERAHGTAAPRGRATQIAGHAAGNA